MERQAFKGNTRHALRQAAGWLNVLVKVYKPKFDEAVEKLLSPEEAIVANQLVELFKEKLAAIVQIQPKG
jgi:hypothetical protein